jgi:hypothetical protein
MLQLNATMSATMSKVDGIERETQKSRLLFPSSLVCDLRQAAKGPPLTTIAPPKRVVVGRKLVYRCYDALSATAGDGRLLAVFTPVTL